MAARSAIEWTEMTWNPVVGCSKVSEGCRFCYAERMARRLQSMGIPQYENGFRVTLVPAALDEPLKWRKPRMVFVNSMGDLFHEQVPLSYIQQVFATMISTPQHTYQILTKRDLRLAQIANSLNWPPNVWIGVSVESAETSSRITQLTTVGASLRFVSFEPLLGSVGKLDLSGIGWVIVGGESGPRARPIRKEWVDQIRELCRTFDLPFFFKQWGRLEFNVDQGDPTASKEHSLYAKGGCHLDGRVCREIP